MFWDRKPISSQSLQQFRLQIRFQRKNKVGAQIASFQLHPAVIPHQFQLGDVNGTANQFRPGRSGNEFHSLVKDIRHGSLNLEAVHLERPFPPLSHIHGTVHLQFRVSPDFQRWRQLRILRGNGTGHPQHRLHRQSAVNVYLNLSVHSHYLAGKTASGMPYIQISYIKITVFITEIAGGPLEFSPSTENAPMDPEPKAFRCSTPSQFSEKPHDRISVHAARSETSFPSAPELHQQ